VETKLTAQDIDIAGRVKLWMGIRKRSGIISLKN